MSLLHLCSPCAVIARDIPLEEVLIGTTNRKCNACHADTVMHPAVFKPYLPRTLIGDGDEAYTKAVRLLRVKRGLST
jgi:hypothetical protein